MGIWIIWGKEDFQFFYNKKDRVKPLVYFNFWKKKKNDVPSLIQFGQTNLSQPACLVSSPPHLRFQPEPSAKKTIFLSVPYSHLNSEMTSCWPAHNPLYPSETASNTTAPFLEALYYFCSQKVTSLASHHPTILNHFHNVINCFSFIFFT